MVPRTRSQASRGWWSLLALGMTALIYGAVLLLAQNADGAGSHDVGNLPVNRVAPAQPADPPARTAPSASVGRAAVLTPPPVRLRFSRLAMDAPVLPVSVGKDGLLDVPDNPRQLGWWSGSGRPGMPSGSVVIDGHVDSATRGLGAFFRLREARPGDQVLLTNAVKGSTRYTVVARRSYPKASLPASEVFARDVGPRLVLITCGGQFDQSTRHYTDNIVIYAVPH